MLICVICLPASAAAQGWTLVYSGSGTLYSEDNGEGGWNNSSDSHGFTLANGGSIGVSYSGTVNASLNYTTPTAAGYQSVTVQCEGTGEGGTYTILVYYMPPPTAHIANRWTAKGGVPVTLNGSGSTGAAPIVSYAWEIGNATVGITTATGATPSCTFPAPFGSSQHDVTVKLTVTDSNGATGSTTRVVTVFWQDAVKVAVQNGTASWAGYGPETPFWCPPYQQITLTANPPAGGAPYSAGWKVNSGTITGLNPAALTTTGTLSTSDVDVSATYGPSTPTNLNASAVAYNSITLTWSASVDNVAVTHYEVYRSTYGLTDVLVGTITAPTTTFVDSHVSPSTPYSYAVKARDADSNRSAASSSVSPTTPAPPDTDSDGVPDVLETVFGTQSNANATSDSSLGLKINRPIP